MVKEPARGKKVLAVVRVAAGNFLEMYDFMVFGYYAAAIGRAFFPEKSEFASLMLSFATFGVILVHPILSVVRDLKIAENGTNYSLQNTVRNALLLPTSREAKYKAKAAIETFCVRLGDVSQAGIIFVGTRLHASISWFASITLGFTVLWLLVAGALYRQHCQKSQEC